MSAARARVTLAELVLLAVLAVVFGFLYWALVQAWGALQLAMGPFGDLAQHVLIGGWMVAAPLAIYVVRKPGVGIVVELVAAFVEVAFLASPVGPTLLVVGLVQGAGAEAAFALTRYRRYGWGVFALSGVLAGLASTALGVVRFGWLGQDWFAWRLGLQVVSGLAQLDVPLPAGTYPGITAAYSGDGVHGGATSGAQTLVVAEHVAPRPVVTVDVPTTAVAGPVTATVTVVGRHSEAVTPEGDVQLIVLDADEHYLLHVNATLVDGSVEVTTPALAAGSYTVLAHYSGSSTQGVYAQADSTEHALTVTAPVVTPDPQPSTPAPVVPTPAPVPALAGSTSSTTPGGSVTLVARGFLPGETVQFHLHSDPVLLGTAVADASGVATLVTTVPTGTAAGLHHVVATGTTSQRTAQIELTVAAAGTSSGTRLAATGTDPAGLL
ncbi:ECF transporter S component, partial [Cellulomonas septica]